MNIIRKQYELGAAMELDVNRVQTDLAKFESRLAAFDAGMVPPAPVAGRKPDALAARTQYRSLLQKEVEYAAKEVEAAQRKFSMGTEHPQGIIDAEIRLIEAKLKVAALDAGLAPQTNSGAGR